MSNSIKSEEFVLYNMLSQKLAQQQSEIEEGQPANAFLNGEITMLQTVLKMINSSTVNEEYARN